MSVTFQDFTRDSTPGNKHIIKEIGLIKGMVACKVIYAANLSDKVCRLGLTRMADELGVDKSTISRSLEWLTDKAYIKKIKEATATEPAHYIPTQKLLTIISNGVAECNTTIAENNPTIAQCNQEEESEEELENTTTTAQQAEALKALTISYQDYIAVTISQIMADKLREYSLKIHPSWIPKAFYQMERANARNWAYIEAILDSCIQAGRWVDKPKRQNGAKPNGKQPQLTPEQAARARQLAADECRAIAG